jgi:hypothetical protein
MGGVMTVRTSAAIILRDLGIPDPGADRFYSICPQCSGKRRRANQKLKCLGVTVHRDGVGWRCLHCNWSGGKRFSRDERPTPRQDNPRRDDLAKWLWQQREPAASSPVAIYLGARGYNGEIPATLGYLPAYRDYPHAMIAAFGMAQEIEPGLLAPPEGVSAVHLTLLNAAGNDKAAVRPNKKVIGPAGGLPIVLTPPNDLLGLAICEGIEDALSAHQALGLGAWAAYSAGNMPKLAALVPAYVEAITIFAHDDDGKLHALELADDLASRGFEVFVEGIQNES